MSDLDRNTLLAKAKAIFCRGMAMGYASGAKGTPVPGKPNAKYFEHIEGEGDWYLRDEYEVDPVTGISYGTTRIEYKGRLIWIMSYGGLYSQEAIACLKGALLASYAAGEFNLGRGKHNHVHGDYIYINVMSQGHSVDPFEKFMGMEGVSRPKRSPSSNPALEKVGGHWFWGMAMI